MIDLAQVCAEGMNMSVDEKKAAEKAAFTLLLRQIVACLIVD
jgi:hypothetical protein